MSNAESAKRLDDRSAITPRSPHVPSHVRHLPNPLHSIQHPKYRVGIKFVELIAPFNPHPVPEGYADAHAKGGEEGNCIGGRKVEQVHGEG